MSRVSGKLQFYHNNSVTLHRTLTICCQSLVDLEGMEVIQAEASRAREAALSGRWENATWHWTATEYVVIDKTHGVDFYNIHEFHDYWASPLDDKPELQLMLNAAGPSRLGAVARSRRGSRCVLGYRIGSSTSVWWGGRGE